MPSIALRFPLPANPQDFELLCLELYKREWKIPDLERLGRPGHRQWGIDLVGTDEQGLFRAVQCKFREQGRKLTASDVVKTVSKVKGYPQRISYLTIATTAPRDPKLQMLAMEISASHIQQGLFRLNVASYDDLNELYQRWPEVAGQYTGSPTAEQGQQILLAIGSLHSGVLGLIRDPGSVVEDSVDAEIDQAASFIEQGQPRVAIVQLERIERRHDGRLTEHHQFRLLANRGNVAKAEEEFGLAARYYLEARRHSDGEKARYLEALAHLFLGDLVRAHELGLKLRQDFPASGLGDAIVVMSAPLSVGVAELERQVGDAVSANSNVRLALALRAVNDGEYAAAESHARRVLERDPRSLGAREILAITLLGAEIEKTQGRPITHQGSALARVIEAVGLLQGLVDSLRERGSPDHLAVLHYRRSHGYHLLSKRIEAAAELGAAYTCAPTNGVVAAAQAFALAKDGKLDDALGVLERLPRPLAPRPALALAQLLGQRGGKADFVSALELLTLGTEATSAEPPEFRSAWAGVLVKLCLSLGEPQTALEAVGKLPSGFIEQAGIDTLRALAFAKAERTGEASDAASAALTALAPATPAPIREDLARLLARLGRHEEAVSIWRALLAPTEVDDDVRRMLNSAHLIDDEDLILEFCKKLRGNGVFDPDCVELELRMAYQRGPRLAVQIANEVLASTIDDRLARHVRLFRAHIGLGTHDRSLLDIDPVLLPAAKDVSPEEGRAVVEVLRHVTSGPTAVEYAYALLRRFPDHPLAAQGLLAVMIGADTATGGVATPEQAAVGAAVRFSVDGEPTEEWVVIEDGPAPSFSQREFPPDHHLAQQLMGRRVGDEFFMRDRPPQPVRGVVREILHKAVYRFQEVLRTAEVRFPETPVAQRFKLDLQEADPEKRFAAIITMAEERRRKIEVIQETYRGGMTPLAVVAKALHSTVFDLLASNFVGTREMPLRCSQWTAVTVGRAAQALASAQPLVLDSTAIFSLFGLEALEGLSGLPLRLVVSENTLYELRGAHVLTPDAIKPAGFVGSEAGRLWYQENDPEMVRQQQARLKQFIGKFERRIEVCAAPLLTPVEPSKRRPLVSALGRSELDALLLAKVNGWTLWSDDQVLAQLAGAEFAVGRVWTEAVVRWLGGTGVMEPHSVSECVLALLGRNYQFTSLTVEDVIHAAVLSSWDAGREPLASAIGRLGDNEWETPGIFRLAGEVLVRAWRASLSDVVAEAFTVRIVEEFASRSEGIDLVVALGRSIDVFFGLDALNAKRAKAVIDTYLRTQSKARS
jgi:tetratricopeptide (TPR) repeat protein